MLSSDEEGQKTRYVLTIRRIRGEGLAAMDSDFWGNSSSDPYCLIKLVNLNPPEDEEEGDEEEELKEVKTEVISATLDPVWEHLECRFVVRKLEDMNLVIHCWDFDFMAKDDFLGFMETPLIRLVKGRAAQLSKKLEGNAELGDPSLIKGSLRIEYDLKEIKGAPPDVFHPELQELIVDMLEATVDGDVKKFSNSRERIRQIALEEYQMLVDKAKADLASVLATEEGDEDEGESNARRARENKARAKCNSLCEAAETRMKERIAKMLMLSFPPHKRTALHLASWNGHDVIVRKILDDLRPVPDMVVQRDAHGMSPLHFAALNGSLETVKRFKAYFARQKHCETCYIEPTGGGAERKEAASYCPECDYKYCEECYERDHNRVLCPDKHFQARRSNLPEKQDLGFKPNSTVLSFQHVTEAKDDRGNYPLHLAAQYGFPETCSMLMFGGALEEPRPNPNAKNEDEKSVVDLSGVHTHCKGKSARCVRCTAFVDTWKRYKLEEFSKL